jgi:hypothetical protein
MQEHATQVQAIAQDVLPSFGLAYLVDDRQVTWGITKSTEGPGLAELRSGQRVLLTLKHLPDFSIVQRYQPLG